MTDAAPTDEFCSYEEFGRGFFVAAVTEERILAGVAGLTGESISFGPLSAGPAKIAKVSATGRIGTPHVERLTESVPQFRLDVPVDLQITIRLPLDEHHFQADVTVRLTLTPRPAPPVRVFIDVEPPTRDDVEVAIHAQTMRASLLQTVGGIEGELRRFVAKYVAREIEKPHIRAARDIDVAARIAGAWDRSGNRAES
ncbi:MAG TPA: hypothetical protein VJ831_08360 [Jatrophihabitantaceae bacterium]|nr:hypothetical protein [Jatrophihabitantaceae bacterium]